MQRKKAPVWARGVSVVACVAAAMGWAVIAAADGGSSGADAPWPGLIEISPPPPSSMIHGVAPERDEARVRPATRAADRALDVLGRVRSNLRATRYQAQTIVREREGVYLWDCSGMAAWVLHRAAPQALAATGRARPAARDFYRAIASAPTNRARRGWVRLPRLADAQPGDVFAWLKPPSWPRRNTGHVGFVLSPPEPVRGMNGAYLVRIADATSVAHESDTRADGMGGGFGEGTIMFLTDERGEGTAYAWHGRYSQWAVQTRVVVGRLVR